MVASPPPSTDPQLLMLSIWRKGGLACIHRRLFPTTAPPTGMGFNSLPPLSISSPVFGFLKSLNLRSVGKELGDVPLVFGWELVVFEPSMVQL